MGKMQRIKGRAFEQKIAKMLRKAYPKATVRRSLQAHRPYEPDVVVEGRAPAALLNLWPELTDSRAPNPAKKLQQAERDIKRADAAGRHDRWINGSPPIPVVIWHRQNQRSIQVTLRAGDLMRLCGVCPATPTLEARNVLTTVDLTDFIRCVLPSDT